MMVEQMKMIKSERGYGEPVKTVYRWIDGVLVSARVYFPDHSILESESAIEAAEWLEADQ